MEKGACPFTLTPSGRNVLHQAAESGSSDVLTYLLHHRYHERGVDINLGDIWQETPLHIAAAKAPVSARLLLSHRASLDVVQEDRQGPLHYASRLAGSERLASVNILSHPYGDHINAQDDIGRTPMMHMLDSPRCVELLLDRAANVHIRDIDERNILHLACIEGRAQILEVFLNNCPDQARILAVQQDVLGDTPLYASFRHRSVECARILLARTTIPPFKDVAARCAMRTF